MTTDDGNQTVVNNDNDNYNHNVDCQAVVDLSNVLPVASPPGSASVSVAPAPAPASALIPDVNSSDNPIHNNQNTNTPKNDETKTHSIVKNDHNINDINSNINNDRLDSVDNNIKNGNDQNDKSTTTELSPKSSLEQTKRVTFSSTSLTTTTTTTKNIGDDTAANAGSLTVGNDDKGVVNNEYSSSSSVDDSEDGDDDESDNDENDDEPGLSLMESRARNIKRNQDYLEQLGLAGNFLSGGGDGGKRQSAKVVMMWEGKLKKKQEKERRLQEHEQYLDPMQDDDDDNDHDEHYRKKQKKRHRGMLLPTSSSFQSSFDAVSSTTASSSPTDSSQRKQSFHTVKSNFHLESNSNHQLLPPLQRLCARYPHREQQIHRLVGLLTPYYLQTTSSSSLNPDTFGGIRICHKNMVSPTPIFVAGPNGTGKTSVVESVLEVVLSPSFWPGAAVASPSPLNNHNDLISGSTTCETTTTKRSTATDQQNNQNTVRAGFACSAYVDCSIADSIEDVLRSIFGQLETKMKHCSLELKRSKRKRSKKGTTMITSSSKSLPQEEAEEDGIKVAVSEDYLPTKTTKDEQAAAAATGVDRSHLSRSASGSNQNPNSLGRKRKTGRGDGGNIPLKEKQIKLKTSDPTAVAVIGEQQAGGFASTGAIVWQFAKDVKRLLNLFEKNHGRTVGAVIVLDHAECLQPLALKRSGLDWTNALSDILLFPRTLGLNVTPVVITTNNLLAFGRFNAHIATSLGNIFEDVQPHFVRFSAYRGKGMLKKILQQPEMRTLVIGIDPFESEFEKRLYSAFLDTLIQMVQNFTSDIKEVVRLCRSLWPQYTKPLEEESFDKTMAHVAKQIAVPNSDTLNVPKDADIFSYLDRRILPFIRKAFEHDLFSIGTFERWTPSDGAPVPHDFPILKKYLLLAAFLCQVNRPDRDRYLFSIQKNGRRRKQDGGDDEDEAYGMTMKYSVQVRIPRPKAFPMERMLSVYVSLVGLHHAAGSWGDEDREEKLLSLGSTELYDAIAQFRDTGLLHEYPARTTTEELRLTEPKFWCSFSLDEAQKLATGIGFPLDRYLL